MVMVLGEEDTTRRLSSEGCFVDLVSCRDKIESKGREGGRVFILYVRKEATRTE